MALGPEAARSSRPDVAEREAASAGEAIATGRRYGVPLQLVATAQQLFGAASALGYGRKDLSAVKFAIEAISAPL